MSARKTSITIPLEDDAFRMVAELAAEVRKVAPWMDEEQFIGLYLAPALLTGVALQSRFLRAEALRYSGGQASPERLHRFLCELEKRP